MKTNSSDDLASQGYSNPSSIICKLAPTHLRFKISSKHFKDRKVLPTIIYSGHYEVNRLRRRRDRRVKEYIEYRSRRVYRPSPPVTMCRITKLVIYLILFFVVLAVFTGVMSMLVMHFRIPADKPAETKTPGLCTVPGKYVGDQKNIVWSRSSQKEMGAIRREMARHVERFGLYGIQRMMDCNLDDSWGYTTGKPCILLKITQSLGFEAVTYDSAIDLPEMAPDELYTYVLQLPEEDRFNRIWVACSVPMEKGVNIKVNYIPNRYFDINALFTRHNVFLNNSSGDVEDGVYSEDPGVRRLIGAQFENFPPNRNIYIHCQLWAKNIPLRAGSAKFMMRLVAPIPPPEVEILDEWED